MKIAIIGAGNMGGAIARGLCKGSVVKPEDITVSNPSSGKLDALKAEFPTLNVTHSNTEAAAGADIVMLAVKPWLVEKVILEIRPTEQQTLVSIAAGVTTRELEIYSDNPQQPCFRVIPNTAISLQQSTTLLACNAWAADKQETLLQLFREMGEVFLLPEAKMAAATAMTSCGIAYALKYIQAVMQAGIELGIYPQDGMKMVAQSMKGAAELILKNETHPSVEIDKVCTPGGLTIKGINALEEQGFTTALIKAVKASCR
ncbi:MAG: pyrroline-5-carboxylate reductase [Bacteroides sp.]|nr:pyrroline-5-carboxylate reductase [Bacteroides sp.]